MVPRKSERLVNRNTNLDLRSRYIKEENKFSMPSDINSQLGAYPGAPTPPPLLDNNAALEDRNRLSNFRSFFGDVFRQPRNSEARISYRKSI